MRFDGEVTTQAPNGEQGQLLLDPMNVTIGVNNADDLTVDATVLADATDNNDYSISVSKVNSLLDTANVTISAQSTIAINGDIVTSNNTSDFTLHAREINVDSDSSITLAGGNLTFNIETSAGGVGTENKKLNINNHLDITSSTSSDFNCQTVAIATGKTLQIADFANVNIDTISGLGELELASSAAIDLNLTNALDLGSLTISNNQGISVDHQLRVDQSQLQGSITQLQTGKSMDFGSATLAGDTVVNLTGSHAIMMSLW